MAIYRDPPQNGKKKAAPEPPTPLFDSSCADDADVAAEGKPWWLSEDPRPNKKTPWPRKANCSPSRLNLADTCMLRWHYKYRERRKDPSGHMAMVGLAVHETYEACGLLRLRRDAKKVPALASVQELLHVVESRPASREGGAKVLQEAQELLEGYGPVDYSRLHAVEQSFTLRVTPQLVVGGYVDMIEVGGGFPVPTEVVLIDWKTGGEVPTFEELFYSEQAGLYLAWARQRWPDADVLRFEVRNVRHSKKAAISWTPELERLHLSMARMRRGQWESGDRTPTVGSHCKHCPYREGDSGHGPCPAYQKALEDGKNRLSSRGGLERMDLPSLLEAYRESKELEDLAQARRKEAGKAIMQKLPEGQTSYKHGDLHAIVSRRRQKRVDSVKRFLADMSEVLSVDTGHLADHVTTVSQQRLSRYVKAIDDDELRSRAEECRSRHQTMSATAPSVQVRRKKSPF